MNNGLINFIHINIAFSALYLLYMLLFRRMTFFRLNRIFLLAIIPLSFIAANTGTGLIEIKADNIVIPELTEPLLTGSVQSAPVDNGEDYSGASYMLPVTIYFSGALILALKLALSTLLLIRLKRKSITEKNSPFTLVFADINLTFSCFNWIFIPHKFRSNPNPVIMMHERVHACKKHTADLILTEIFVIFFWINPFVYLYRKSVRSNHEYEADSEILSENVKKSEYLQLILNNLEYARPMNGLLNYFNIISLKKRVKMITAKSTQKAFYLAYLLIVPVMILMSFTIIQSPDKTVQKLVLTPSTDKGSFTLPVQITGAPVITSRYGITFKNPVTGIKAIHNGTDIKAPLDTPVLSAADGVVIKAEYEENWGNFIVIKHPEGFETWYAHLNKIDVKTGDEVRKGDKIGTVGSTGVRSTGPHLHFEIKLNGKNIDPGDKIESLK